MSTLAGPEIDITELFDFETDVPCENYIDNCTRSAEWRIMCKCKCRLVVLLCDPCLELVKKEAAEAGAFFVCSVCDWHSPVQPKFSDLFEAIKL